MTVVCEKWGAELEIHLICGGLLERFPASKCTFNIINIFNLYYMEHEVCTTI